jgi:hypothetical protein
MSAKLEAGDLRPGAVALVERMKVENRSGLYAALARAWVPLHTRLKTALPDRTVEVNGVKMAKASLTLASPRS